MRGRIAFGVGVAVAIGVALAAFACSSSHALACPSLPLACPSLDGVTSFCSFAGWGCPREAACDGYVALIDTTVDAKLTYFYSAQTGAYVATIAEDFNGGSARCTNGPSSFTPPTSCTFPALAACEPIAQDGGIGPIDASLDAGDAGAPSGVPSGQPLALPPRPRR